MRRGTIWMVLAVAAVLVAPISASHAEEDAKAADASASPPADSPLAKVEPGMDEGQVAAILGNPHMRSSWRTGKGRIPFYQGSDRRRELWQYQAIGSVTFSKGSYTAYKVIEVVYNPDQLAGVEIQPEHIYVEGSAPVVIHTPHVPRPRHVHVPGPRPRVPRRVLRPHRW